MRATVEDYLRAKGYEPRIFADYDEAMNGLEACDPDALVVDVQGVPRDQDGTAFPQFSQWLEQVYGQDGPSIAYLLRKGARRPHFRVEGVVLKKPFSIELLGETLRRSLGQPRRGHETHLDMDLDPRSNVLRSNGRSIHLTNIEANLLAYLIDHEGQILHPRDLLVEVWRYHDSAGADTLVRAHVSNLRRKLRAVLDTDEQIETIRGKGYRFSA